MKKFTLYLLFSLFGFSLLNAQHDRVILGIHSNNISKKKADLLGFDNPYGEYITSVNQNTAAEQLGLQPFDYVYAINGQEFSQDIQIHDILRQKAAGDMVEVSYIRNGEIKSGQASLKTSRESKRRHRNDEQDPFLGVESRHVQNKVVEGISVNIVECSTAKAMGLADGDIITQIDNYPILDWHDAGAAINAREVGGPIKVIVNRDGQSITKLASIRSLAATQQRPCPDEMESAKEEALIAINESPSVQVEDEAAIEAEIAQLEMELTVSMENVTQEESDAMKQSRNIDMPIVNNLQIEALNIFPNPNDGIFNLQFDLPEEAETTIRIFSASGRMIYQSNLGSFTGVFSDRIDISNNAIGTYFLQIMQGEKSVSKKVIVAREGTGSSNN